MTRVETIIIPSRPLLCAGDALDAELPVTLPNGVPGVLAVPVSSPEPLSAKGGGSLMEHPAARLTLDLLYWRKEATWGSFYKNDKGAFAHVMAFSVWFDTHEENKTATGNTVWTVFQDLYRRFAEFAEAISGRIQEMPTGLGQPVENYFLWYTAPAVVPEMLPTPPQRISCGIAGSDDYLSLSILQQAATLANTQQVLRTEHRLLIQANRSLQAHNLRVAILDAATAVEMVLTGEIDKQLLPLPLKEKDRKTLIRKLGDGIGRKSQALGVFGVQVSVNSTPRNMAIHS